MYQGREVILIEGYYQATIKYIYYIKVYYIEVLYKNTDLCDT